MAKKSNSQHWPPQAELGTLISPSMEIHLDIALDILKLQQKIIASEKKLVDRGEYGGEASEVTDPLEDLDRAFHKVWETIGVRISCEATSIASIKIKRSN